MKNWDSRSSSSRPGPAAGFRPGPRARCKPVLILALSLGACAHFTVDRKAHVVERGPPMVLGPARDTVTATDYAMRWLQLERELIVEIRERRHCREVLHIPVTRIERVRKLPDGVVFWELGLGLITGALAALAFSQPQAFGPRLIAPDGRQVVDPSAGNRIGAVFAGIATLNFVALAVDLSRIRAYTTYTGAYRESTGEEIGCTEPQGPLALTPVSLHAGEIVVEGRTDESGRVRFALPSGLVTPAKAAIRIDERRALALPLSGPAETPGGGAIEFPEEPKLP